LSILKNLKISKKLILIIAPAIIAMIALLIAYYSASFSTYNQAKIIYYDNLFTTECYLLNADRDYYQSELAQNKAFFARESATAEEMKTYISDRTSNLGEVRMHLGNAESAIKKIPMLYNNFTCKSISATLKDNGIAIDKKLDRTLTDNDLTFQQLYKDFTDELNTWEKAYDPETGEGDYATADKAFVKARDNLKNMTDLQIAFSTLQSYQLKKSLESQTQKTAIVVAFVLLLISILSTLIVRYLRNNIKYITGISQRVAQGELSIQIDEAKITHDEIGQLCDATGQILVQLNEYDSYIKEITQVLDTMASGDMRITLSKNYNGEFSAIKDALVRISSSLNQTLTKIADSSEQVDSGARQVSNGAHALAQGTTEQASTIQELSASISDISEAARKNAANVRQAADDVGHTVSGIEESSTYMNQMLNSMNNIDKSSGEISKIIKVIDDIAFQTNILALNAAVEAARAGIAGKGFAVVADEVRNLASKSANAAKQTTELIEGTIQAVSGGSKIAENTSRALEKVSVKAAQIKDIIGKIDSASSSQAIAITQINQGLEQISAVVQTNSATAEESAAASEELSGQSTMLLAEVGKFKLFKDKNA